MESVHVAEHVICKLTNRRCANDPDCHAASSRQPCWESETIPCCGTTDKAHCCFCRAYLAYVHARGGCYRLIEGLALPHTA